MVPAPLSWLVTCDAGTADARRYQTMTYSISTATATATATGTENSRHNHGSRCTCRKQLPHEYRNSGFWSSVFLWATVVITTLFRPSLALLTSIWQRFTARVEVEGLENLPTDGSFILALNHVKGAGSAVALISIVLTAVSGKRADTVDRTIVMVGRREPRNQNIIGRGLRSIVNWAKRRWAGNILQIPLDSDKSAPKAMREWREASRTRASLVFPEGIARPFFGPIRDGSGVWLSAMPAPTVPVAVWWHNRRWHVRFGKPVAWSSRRELRDVQVGLEIARLLPKPLIQRSWAELLERQRAVRAANA
jgi:hypothetical protein